VRDLGGAYSPAARPAIIGLDPRHTTRARGTALVRPDAPEVFPRAWHDSDTAYPKLTRLECFSPGASPPDIRSQLVLELLLDVIALRSVRERFNTCDLQRPQRSAGQARRVRRQGSVRRRAIHGLIVDHIVERGNRAAALSSARDRRSARAPSVCRPSAAHVTADRGYGEKRGRPGRPPREDRGHRPEGQTLGRLPSRGAPLTVASQDLGGPRGLAHNLI
jgi:hypothetical protein